MIKAIISTSNSRMFVLCKTYISRKKFNLIPKLHNHFFRVILLFEEWKKCEQHQLLGFADIGWIITLSLNIQKDRIKKLTTIQKNQHQYLQILVLHPLIITTSSLVEQLNLPQIEIWLKSRSGQPSISFHQNIRKFSNN
jgi:hypothetical protein